MKPRVLFLFIITFIVVGCGTKEEKATRRQADIRPFPILIDTFGIETYGFRRLQDTTWQTTANYRFYYIGKPDDTLYLHPFGYEEYAFALEESPEYNYGESADIKVRTDTSRKFLNSYPVLLTNKEPDTVCIGYGDYIPLIMEAVDSAGNWEPIEEPFIYVCGVGVKSVILPPGECVISLAPVFRGDYKTKLRLSLGNNYSEPFDGSIHYRQFRSKYDSRGSYTEE
jgi:hypothetical protein